MAYRTEELFSIGNTELSGDTFINGVLTVYADQYLSGNTYITGIAEIDGDLTVDANTIITGDLYLSGNTYIDGNFYGRGTMEFSTYASFDNGIGVSGDIQLNSQLYTPNYQVTILQDSINVNAGVSGSSQTTIGPNSIFLDNGAGETLTITSGYAGFTSGTDGAAGSDGSSGTDGAAGSSGVAGKSMYGFLTFSGQSTGTPWGGVAADIPALVASYSGSYTTFTGSSLGSIPADGYIDGDDGNGWAGVAISGVNTIYVSYFDNLGNDITSLVDNPSMSPWVLIIQSADNTIWGAWRSLSTTEGSQTWSAGFNNFLTGTTNTSTLTFADFGENCKVFFVDNGLADGKLDCKQGGTTSGNHAVNDINSIFFPNYDINGIDCFAFLTNFIAQTGGFNLTIQNDTDWVTYYVNNKPQQDQLWPVTYLASTNSTMTFTDMGVVRTYFILKGANGADGAAGASPYKSIWDSAAYYYVGDMIEYNTLFYYCIVEHQAVPETTPDTDGTNWVASVGTSGSSGVNGTSGSSGTNGSVDPNILSPQNILYKNEAGVLTGSTGLKYTQYNSLIVGNGCSSPTSNSIAVGESCQAAGNDSFAMGNQVVVNGTWSGGFGYSQAIGGFVNFSTGLQSSNQSPLAGVSMGSHLDCIGATQTVIGKYNVATGNTVISDWANPTYDPNNPLFIVGCGTGSTNKRNGFLVRENMNADFGGNVNIAGSLKTATSKFNYQSAYSITVGSTDFTTLAATIAWLAAGNMSGNTTLLLTADNEAITDTITVNLPFNLAIKGGAYDQNTLSAGAGLTNKPMFILQTNTSFTKVKFDGSTLASYGTLSTENCFNLATDGVYVEIKDFLVTGFYNGIYQTSNAEIWTMEGGYNNCYNAGYELNTSKSGAIFRSTLNDWSVDHSGYTYTGIKLTSGHTIYLSSQNDISQLTAVDTFINYDGTQISYTDLTINGCIWNNFGTFRSGFDFTLKRDADIVLLNNSGDENMAPHAKYVAQGNISGITLTTTNQAIPWTPYTTYSKKFSFSPATQTITYLPTHKKSVIMWISGAITASNQPATVTISVVKNSNFTGTTYGNMSIYIDQNSRAFNFSTNVYLDDVLENETFVIAGKCSTGTEPVILQDLNWLILSQ